jgi:hypothetical protein
VTNQTALARFRFSSAGGLAFDGLAADGEVEDYVVRVVQRGPAAARLSPAAGIILTSQDQRSGTSSRSEPKPAGHSSEAITYEGQDGRRVRGNLHDEVLSDAWLARAASEFVAGNENAARTRHAIDDVLAEMDWDSAGFRHLEQMIEVLS